MKEKWKLFSKKYKDYIEWILLGGMFFIFGCIVYFLFEHPIFLPVAMLLIFIIFIYKQFWGKFSNGLYGSMTFTAGIILCFFNFVAYDSVEQDFGNKFIDGFKTESEWTEDGNGEPIIKEYSVFPTNEMHEQFNTIQLIYVGLHVGMVVYMFKFLPKKELIYTSNICRGDLKISPFLSKFLLTDY